MISGLPTTRLAGSVAGRTGGCVHLPTQDLVAQPQAPQQVSLLAAPTQEWEMRSPHEAGDPPRCQYPSSPPWGGRGVLIKELSQVHLKYITTAQVMWQPLWVLGAARNNKTTDKGRNPDTESTKGLFLLRWGKAAASPLQDFLFSKYMNCTQWFSSCPSFLPIPNPSCDFSASLGQKPICCLSAWPET